MKSFRDWEVDMIFGSVLARLKKIRLDAADGQTVIFNNTALTRAALCVVGVPHMGLRIRASLILGEIQKNNPRTIIDAGSGNGLYTLELAARGYVVHAMELNQEKLFRVESYAQEAGLMNVSFQVADLTKIDHVTRQADLVVCSDVLEHIPDDGSAVRVLRALTRPGGILVVTVPRISQFASRIENSFGHERIGYEERQLCGTLESAGFQILRTGQFFKIFGRIAWGIDRGLRHSNIFRILFFWPLFLLSKLDGFIPWDHDAGGIYVVSRAPLDQ